MDNQSENDRWDTVARQVLETRYGIQAKLRQLPGENRNYLAEGEDERRFVLKIAAPDAPAELAAIEIAVIGHAIKRGFKCDLPAILPNRQGEMESEFIGPDGVRARARLLTFVSGTPMDDLPDISLKLLFDLGRTLAEFDCMLEDLDLPAAHRPHRWEVVSVDQHRDKIPLVEDAARRELLSWAIDFWASEAKPFLQALPWQIIHGDGHDENIMVRGEAVSGLLDFGDCNYNPTVCELAVCLTYMMMERDNPLQAGAAVVAGYSQLRPLNDAEISVLFPLIIGRLAITLSIAAERMKAEPANPNWYVSWDSSWALLQAMREMDRDSATKVLVTSINV